MKILRSFWARSLMASRRRLTSSTSLLVIPNQSQKMGGTSFRLSLLSSQEYFWSLLAAYSPTGTTPRQGEVDLSVKRIDLVAKFMPYLSAGEDTHTQRNDAVAARGLLGDKDLALFLAPPHPTTKSAIEISKVQSKGSPDQGTDIASVKLQQGVQNNLNNLKIGHTILFDGFKNYSIAGFNLVTAAIVPWGTGKPDLEVANPDPEHLAPAVLFLENDSPPYTAKDWPPGKIPANAGISRMPQQSLEAVVEAPESGYAVHYFKPDVGGVYCVRTWDGQHFAKIKITDVGVDRVGFDWVYQPSGSRRFE